MELRLNDEHFSDGYLTVVDTPDKTHYMYDCGRVDYKDEDNLFVVYANCNQEVILGKFNIDDITFICVNPKICKFDLYDFIEGTFNTQGKTKYYS